MSSDARSSNRKLARTLALVSAGTFCLCFAMIPLYDVFCEITGVNGKTGRLSMGEAHAAPVAEDRWVTVQFDAGVNTGLPWDFVPKVRNMKVRPGELYEAEYVATNRAPRALVGNAVPSVAPNLASMYFNKTECFCFTEQLLEAGESRDMPVRFMIDPAMPEEVKVLTLSYRFFLNDLATAREAESAEAGSKSDSQS